MLHILQQGISLMKLDKNSRIHSRIGYWEKQDTLRSVVEEIYVVRGSGNAKYKYYPSHLTQVELYEEDLREVLEYNEPSTLIKEDQKTFRLIHDALNSISNGYRVYALLRIDKYNKIKGDTVV